MTEARYGSWRSPITADLIVQATIGVGSPAVRNDETYWIEMRPTEAGRCVVVRRRRDGSTEDVVPPPFSARTRVHEYGGGDYTVAADGTVYFASFADQRIYRVSRGRAPEPVTRIDQVRYADAVLDERRNRLVCVREDHRDDGEPENTIVAVDLTTGDETIVVRGNDFYAYPRLSPDGARLAWMSWDHPNMPWDASAVHVGRLDPDDRLVDVETIAGGAREAVLQPHWGPDGTLYFVSDRTGWWNLYRWRGGRIDAIAPRAAEFGGPLWRLGTTTFDVTADEQLVCTYGERGTWRLATIDPDTGALRDIPTPFTAIGSLSVADGRAIFVGASPTRPAAVVALDLATGAIETIKRTSDVAVDDGYVSVPEAVEFPTEDGLTAHAFYYAPRNRDFTAPPGEKPPLLVMSHGGPTGATSAAFSLRTQYWTSRGFAVLDVNYGGSTGYGRAYRERLDGRWGIVDVDDCVNGARELVRRGLVDGERLAITGGSAGGYTTLCVLTFREAFKAGASHYGIADLEALARDTHKFESRYTDRLVGPWPEARDVYVARSPIHHVDRLHCPVVFFQGLDDRVVPPNQAEMMVAALRAKGLPVAYVPFEGEQHGFRRADTIKRALEGELTFYARVFGFPLAEPTAPLRIENLAS